MIHLFRSKSEFIFAAAIIFAAVFMAKFPTLYNWLNTPQGFVSSKNSSWFDAWDTNFQVSDIRWGMRKGILAQNTYTTLPHNSEFIYQFYTSLGFINRYIRLDPFIMFHLGSVVSSILLLLVCYWVIGIFLKDQLVKYGSFIIIALGGGIGALGRMFQTADLTVAGFTMINALERGSEAISTAMLLSTFALLFLWHKSDNKKYLISALLTSIVSITLHPPFGALYIAVSLCIAVYGWQRRKKVHLFLFPVIHFLLFTIFYFFVLSSLLDNPGFAGVTGQDLFTLDSLRLILGFGLLSPLIIWAILFMKQTDDEFVILKLFFFIQALFMFLPFGFHLYYVKGFFVWGVLLSMIALTNVLRGSWFIRVLILLVLLSLFSRIYAVQILLSPSIGSQFFYIRDDEAEVIQYMEKLPADTSFISLYRIGNLIPAFTDNRVYYGHNFQSPNSKEKKLLAGKFYTTLDNNQRYALLTENNIDYIYYGLEERQLRHNQGMTVEKPFEDLYPLVFNYGDIFLYKVATATPTIQP